MSEEDAAAAPAEEQCELVVTVGGASNIGDGTEEWPSTVQLQFPGEELVVSEEVVGGHPEYALEKTFARAYSQCTYDVLASESVTANIMSGEELYGTVQLPLIELLQGALTVGGDLEVVVAVKDGDEPPEAADPVDPDDENYQAPAKPSLKLQVCLAKGEPLFSEDEIAESNFLTVAAGTVWSLPPNWLKTDGKSELDADIFEYKLTAMLPLDGAETAIEIPGGKLVLGVPPEEPDGSEDPAAAETETDPRAATENEQHGRIEWKYSKRFFMNAAAMDKFKEMADEESPVIFTLTRTLSGEAVDPGWIDMNAPKYTGDVNLDISRMIIPGVDTSDGRTRVEATNTPMTEPEAGGKAKKPNPISIEPEETPMAEQNGGVYAVSNTYAKVSLSLAEPVVARPGTPRRPSLAPGDLVPPRPPLPRFMQPKDATIELQQTVRKTISTLVTEYKSQFPASPSCTEEMHKDFLYQLSHTGKYHTFKEKLKKAVVRVVREKFKKDGTETPEDMANFYNDLYVYLMENTMQALNQTFEEQSRDVALPNPVPEVGTVESYIRLAQESEILLKFDLASKYRQECIVMNSDDPQLWHDYGLFALRSHDMTKAEECFRESLSLQGTNPVALMVYGVNLAMRESFEEAESFLQAVIDLEPNCVVCWAVRGLMFDLTERSEDARHCFMQAMKIQKDIDTGVIEASELCPRTYEHKSGVHDLENHLEAGAGHLQAANFLLELHATALAEKALQLTHTVSGRTVKAFCSFARLYMQRQDFLRVEENLQEALSIDPDSLEAWTLRAHSQFLQAQACEAISSYEKALELRAEPMDNAVYLRLGQLLLDAGQPEQLERAKQVFLKACTTFSTASSWLGVGIACYKRGQYDQAEEALVEANIADNQNGVVWAYICLVCIQLKRDDEADKALDFALQRGVDRAALLQELGGVYVGAGKPGVAEGALRRALLLREDATVRIGLADAIRIQGRDDEAIGEYMKVVDGGMADDEGLHKHAVEELVGLLKRVNRPEDAKRYAKMIN